MPLITVIIPYFDGLTYLNACLEAIRNSKFSFDSKMVILNAPQGGAPIPGHIIDDARIIDLGGPAGYARAVNAGVEAAESEFVCLCDADAFLGLGCVERLLAALQSESAVRFVGPTLIDPRTDTIVDCGIGLRRHGHFHPWLGRSLADLQRHDGNGLTIWPAICSAVMLFRRSDFLELGGMDPSYVDFFQDVDFCLRARTCQRYSGIVPNAYAFHMGRSSGVHTPHSHSDMLAHHFCRHGRHWASTVRECLNEQRHFYETELPFPVDAIWVDLSTLAAPDEYRNVIEETTRLSNIPSTRPKTRDPVELNLFNHVGYEALRAALPVIYFVDTFGALVRNQFWISQRCGRGDIVIDRHCNIVTFDSLQLAPSTLLAERTP